MLFPEFGHPFKNTHAKDSDHLMAKRYRLLGSGFRPADAIPVFLAVCLIFCSLTLNISNLLALWESVASSEDTALRSDDPVHDVETDIEAVAFADGTASEPPQLPLSEDGETLDEWFSYNLGFSGKPLETEPATAAQIKVACIGDSITYGYGILDWTENNYPTVLQDLLGDDYHVQNFGVNGGCIQTETDHPYTNYNSYPDSKSYDADVVVFMMGSNDSKVSNWQGETAFRNALYALLADYSDARIILCTPSDCFGTELYPGEDGVIGYELQPAVIENIAEIIREVAAERGYPLVDIYALTSLNPQWFSIDGVHPNNEGAAAIANAVYEAVSTIDLEN